MTDVPTPPDTLPLEDLAKILDRGAELDPEAHARLARLFRDDPRCAAQVAQLDALAAQAGHRDSPWTALELNRRLDQLLIEWQDPTEILGLPDAESAGLAGLIRIAEARAKCSNDPSRLLEIRERLIAAELAEFEDTLKPFVRRLIPMSPEAVGRVFALLAMLYQWKNEEQGTP
jgi:hypothetical protein